VIGAVHLSVCLFVCLSVFATLQVAPSSLSSFGRGHGRGHGRHSSPLPRVGVRHIQVDAQTAPPGYKPAGYRSTEQTSSLETPSENDNDNNAFHPEQDVWVSANLPDLTALDNADIDDPVMQQADR